MGQNRKNISIPDDANDILQSLATDCGMDYSQCITQLLRRHHNDIRTLFSINVCSHTHDCTRIIKAVPTIAKTHTESIGIKPVYSALDPTIEPLSEPHSEELARLQALSGGQKFKAMNRITELKQILGD